jgi:ribosome-associated protein
MAEALFINEKLTIPAELLQFKAVRSPGPGGQNVNKLATCVELRFNPTLWGQLNEKALARLLIMSKNRLDAEGNIIIESKSYRSQYRNILDAQKKLKTLILKCLVEPKKRKPTKPTKSSIEKRIKNKKIQSEKKQNRQKLPPNL